MYPFMTEDIFWAGIEFFFPIKIFCLIWEVMSIPGDLITENVIFSATTRGYCLCIYIGKVWEHKPSISRSRGATRIQMQ